jgi:hypothetical protein
MVEMRDVMYAHAWRVEPWIAMHAALATPPASSTAEADLSTIKSTHLKPQTEPICRSLVRPSLVFTKSGCSAVQYLFIPLGIFLEQFGLATSPPTCTDANAAKVMIKSDMMCQNGCGVCLKKE